MKMFRFSLGTPRTEHPVVLSCGRKTRGEGVGRSPASQVEGQGERAQGTFHSVHFISL